MSTQQTPARGTDFHDAPTPSSPPRVGGEPARRVGQYELFEQLGRGGMGTVYRARHVSLKRWVAFKILPPERLQDPHAVARFRREMEAVGQVEHPNVVRATDAGEADGVHYLVMELLGGVTLAQLVRQRGPLSPADACELTRRAALGLHYVHERGIVHRDVKLSNVMLTADGEVKVLDLGLALLRNGGVADEEVTGLTASGQILGTSEFVAPEQWNSVHDVDGRADVYSLGCTLYKLLTGKAPYPSADYPSLGQMMTAHVLGPLPPMTGRDELPPPLDDVLAKMLAKKPGDRFADMAQVAAALEPFAAGAGLEALATARPRAPETPPPGALTTPHTPDRPTVAPARAAPPRRGKRVAFAFGAVVLVAALGAYFISRPSGKTESPPDKSAEAAQVPAEPAGLLDKEPAVLRWPPAEVRSVKLYDAGKRELLLTTPGLGMMTLGKKSAPRFRLAVTVQQNPWAGYVGLFFGYRRRPVNGVGETSYHVVELEPLAPADDGPRFRLIWKLVREVGPPGNTRDVTITYGVAVLSPFSGEAQRLALAVGPGGLEAAGWGKQSCALSAAALKPNAVADSDGLFGVYVRSGNGVFRDAEYFTEKEP